MSHYRITLYIPSAEEKSEHHIEQSMIGFSSIAGGASRQDIHGAWLMKDGALCTEPVAMISSIVSDDTLPKATALARTVAQDIKVSLHQEAVLVTVDEVKQFMLV